MKPEVWCDCLPSWKTISVGTAVMPNAAQHFYRTLFLTESLGREMAGIPETSREDTSNSRLVPIVVTCPVTNSLKLTNQSNPLHSFRPVSVAKLAWASDRKRLRSKQLQLPVRKDKTKQKHCGRKECQKLLKIHTCPAKDFIVVCGNRTKRLGVHFLITHNTRSLG